MKNICLSLIVLLSVWGCKSNPDAATIHGEIKGISNDTLLLYSNDEWSEFIEKIEVKNGKFSHTLSVDTLREAILVFHQQQTYPVYFDRGDKIEIKGDTASSTLKVKGNKFNKELTDFYSKLDSIVEKSDSLIEQRVEMYIRSHQTSLPAIYLLDKYFIQKDSLDSEKIKRLIAYMDGTLQDKPTIEKISKYLEETEKSFVGRSASSFSLTNAQGDRISRTDYRNKVLLLHFWASWCDSCSVQQADLRRIYKVHSKAVKNKERELDEKFGMVGISLDIDKADWQKAVENDTLKWTQVCEFKGWETPIVANYSIATLPYTILIGADGKIVARGLTGEELANKVKELVDIEKEKEKEKERKKKKK